MQDRRVYYEAPITTKPWRDSKFHQAQKVEKLDSCHDLIRTKVPGGWMYVVKCTAHSGMSQPTFAPDPDATA